MDPRDEVRTGVGNTMLWKASKLMQTTIWPWYQASQSLKGRHS